MTETFNRIGISCNVNGEQRRVQAFLMERLLDVLREEMHLTGTKEGCGEGECGACAVLINGAIVNSCLVPAIDADGADIRTIEGMARGEQLNAVQEAFLACGGAQCGICTPGMVIASVWHSWNGILIPPTPKFAKGWREISAAAPQLSENFRRSGARL